MSNLCKCGRYRQKKVAGPNSKFPGREYYCCNECSKFDWADNASPSRIRSPAARTASQDLAGPPCQCGTATVGKAVKKDGPNKGKKFWTCASWPRGCNFFEWQDPPNTPNKTTATTVPSTPESSAKKRPALPGYASYETDWKRKELLQQLLDSGVDHSKLRAQSGGKYDGFELEAAWKIHNPTRQKSYDEALQREALKMAHSSSAELLYNLPVDYRDFMEQLGMDSMKPGEVFLLHGTNPTNLHGILFEGLNPEVARNGNFGRGTYFAESAVKIDQYAVTDARFDKEGDLSQLHKSLYQRTQHPRQVRYCLVSRVVLGRPQLTSDGKTILNKNKNIDDTRPLFQDSERSRLTSFTDGVAPSSLIGEVGGIKSSFREFVVFQPDQIFVEYVIAYRRARKFCDCHQPVVERTVSKATENRGRKILLCGNNNDGKGCGFIRMFPVCHCLDSALVKTSHSASNPDRKYFTCRLRNCEYFSWCEEVVGSPMSSPYKKQRTA